MRSALQRYTTRSVPADFVARLNAGVLALDATLALGSRPAPNTVQPAMPHRAASRAAPVGGTARTRSYAGHFHHGNAGAVARASATRQVVARLSPSRFTSVARQRGARLTDARLLSGEGWGDRTPRVAHACAAGVAVV